jgi:hypothetical protein
VYLSGAGILHVVQDDTLKKNTSKKQDDAPQNRDDNSNTKANAKNAKRQLLGFLLRDPFVGTGFKEIEGEGSAVEHLVVEGADVELGS